MPILSHFSQSHTNDIHPAGIYHLPKFSTLKIAISKGFRPAAINTKVFTNYPVVTHSGFERAIFHEVPLCYSSPDGVDGHEDCVWFCSLDLRLSGPFEFYVEFPSEEGLPRRSDISRFIVDPLLKINNDPIPLAGICLQTVIVKCIPGTISSWRQGLAVSKLSNYNMIHFTPVQKLGASRSPYSINDQLSLAQGLFIREDEKYNANSSFFLKEEQKLQLLQDCIRQLEREYRCLSMVDVVWNHTSFDSAWLIQHPEAAYSPQNSPHLQVAFELDEGLFQFTRELERGNYKERGLSNVISDEGELARLMNFVRHDVLTRLKLWEYYVVDVAECVDKFRACLIEYIINKRDSPETGPDPIQLRYPQQQVSSMTFEQRVETLKHDGLLRRPDTITDEHAPFGQFRFPYELDMEAALALFYSSSHRTNSTQTTKVASEESCPQYVPHSYAQYHTYQNYVRNVRTPSISGRPTSPLGMEDPFASEIPESDIQNMCTEFQRALDLINEPFYRVYDRDIDEIVNNITGTVRWERLNPHGPHLREITQHSPLVRRYFTVRKLGSAPNGNPSSPTGDYSVPVTNGAVKSPRLSNAPPISQSPVFKLHGTAENQDSVVFANNGWIFDSNQTSDFIGPHSKAYYLRQVVIWSDCVKIRYGKKAEDSPWIWDHMKKYAQLMARIFHGFRIDNAHSTPIHVAEYLLDAARQVRPDLYVIAELFTGSEDKDKEYVNRLGLNALIREGMNAGTTSEMARYMHRFGDGKPIGRPAPKLAKTLQKHPQEAVLTASLPSAIFFDCTHDNPMPAEKRTPQDTLPHAALVSMCYCATGSARGFDELYSQHVNIATVNRPYNMQASVATGIIMAKHFLNSLHTQMAVEGFDEMHIDLKNENVLSVTRHNPAKHESYVLVCSCAYMHVDYVPNTSIPRVSSTDSLPAGVVGPTNSAFQTPTRFSNYSERNFRIRVPGRIDKVVFAAQLSVPPITAERLEKQRLSKCLRGLDSQLITFKADTINTICTVSKRVDKQSGEVYSDANFHDFKAGSVVIFHVTLMDEAVQSMIALEPFIKSQLEHLFVPQLQQDEQQSQQPRRPPQKQRQCDVEENQQKEQGQLPPEIMVELPSPPPAAVAVAASDDIRTDVPALKTPTVLVNSFSVSSPPSVVNDTSPSSVSFHSIQPSTAMDFVIIPTLPEILSKMDLLDMNYLLYRCESEERAVNSKRGVYFVPNYGELPFCGLKSVRFLLSRIRENADMGHPFFGHLREGNWLMEYLCDRLRDNPRMSEIREYLEQAFGLVKRLPRHLIPKYFDSIVMTVIRNADQRCLDLMSRFVRDGDSFVKCLALNSVAFFGVVSTAKLDFRTSTGTEWAPSAASLAAGLPHFAAGYMRNWGRDTFISLRGMFLVTGRFAEARQLLLGYASCLRHGLIPNLLDGSMNPRYNSRDATWWFLQALQNYVCLSDEGSAVFEADVVRHFPFDDQQQHFAWDRDPQRSIVVHKLSSIVQEIMEKHANGIHFREWNAGKTIDERMRDQGFNIDISLDTETGFLLGGNEFNCGTWMDKMGESHTAGNFSLPATPRDGAPIEIVGLVKSTVRWLGELAAANRFPYDHVKIRGPANDGQLSYKEWNDRLQRSFSKHFYIPANPAVDAQYVIQPNLVHRRGIFKDVTRCSTQYCEYQLRPNMCIAMTVAPELFDPKQAAGALRIIKDALLGPLGMKTLDPKDLNYRGDYNNNEDSSDFYTSRGFNYHQGPEWLWPLGYYLRAKLLFEVSNPESLWAVAFQQHRILNAHRQHINNSAHLSLPELTNANGKFCPFGCAAQTWSVATILDVLYDTSRVLNLAFPS